MTITRYNEWNVDSRACYLTNAIGETEVLIGVEFTHPSGSIRLTGFTQFTHFTASFEGRTYVYKITNFRAVNGNVCEISYTLDFFKDFFYHVNTTSLSNIQVMRSTNEDDWSKWVDDNQYMYNGKIQETVFTSFFNVNNYTICIVMKSSSIDSLNSGLTYYFLDIDEWLTLNQAAIRNDDLGWDNSVVCAYLVPLTVRGINKLSFDGITFLKSNGGIGKITVPVYVIQRINENNNIYMDVPLGTITAHSFKEIFNDELTINIPYIGTFKVNIGEMFFSDNNLPTGDITLNLNAVLHLSLSDGKLDLSFRDRDGNDTFVIVGSGQLPTICLPSSSAGYEKLQITKDYNRTIINSASSMITGGIGAVTPAAASMVSSYIETQDKLTMLSKSGVSMIGGVSGYSGFFNGTIKVIRDRKVSVETLQQHGAHKGYICLKDISNITLTTGNKYWLNGDNMVVNGPDWYRMGVKSDIASDYIYYNGGN